MDAIALAELQAQTAVLEDLVVNLLRMLTTAVVLDPSDIQAIRDHTLARLEQLEFRADTASQLVGARGKRHLDRLFAELEPDPDRD